MLPAQRPKAAAVPDPLPDPEPASPSLPEPDPGVFHPEPPPQSPIDAASQDISEQAAQDSSACANPSPDYNIKRS
jgi:hypothetical protein